MSTTHDAGTPGASSLELRIPPVAVLLGTAFLMWTAAAIGPARLLDGTSRVSLTTSLLVAGVALAAWGVRDFRRARTTVDPLAPERATALVTSGIYRWTRNPMYLGMLLVLGAWAAWLGSPVALLGLPLFLSYMNRYQVRPEERALAARFPEHFEPYTRRVRRWL
jgi:protein-S-isoprenylcysteine O-methyltransferase Ste14